jgi:hypothetical protein
VVILYRHFETTYRSHLQGVEKFLGLGFLDAWKWYRYVVPKRWYRTTTLLCVISQKSAHFICIASEAWNQAQFSVAFFLFLWNKDDTRIYNIWTSWNYNSGGRVFRFEAYQRSNNNELLEPVIKPKRRFIITFTTARPLTLTRDTDILSIVLQIHLHLRLSL